MALRRDTARPRCLRASAAFLSFALCLSLDGVAAAAEPDAAAEVKKKADAAFDGRHYAEALAAYQVALAQGGDPKIRYNIAQTLTALERYPEALRSYQAFLAEAPAGTLNAAQQERFFALLDELKAKIARLQIHCDAPGARVLLRNTTLGETPFEGPISVNAGPAKIEVLAEGYKPFAEELTLDGGRTRTVEVNLERIDFTGKLAVDSRGVAAHVRIDGVDRGVTPVVAALEQGAHVVRVSADGYVGQGKTVKVDAGHRTELTFSLVRSPDYTLAYAGFAVGFVGVAAGSVTGVLAFTTLSSAKAQCDNTRKQCGPTGQPDLQTSKTFGVLSSVAFGVGAAGVGVGVLGWLTARPGREASKPVVELVFLPTDVELLGSF